MDPLTLLPPSLAQSISRSLCQDHDGSVISRYEARRSTIRGQWFTTSLTANPKVHRKAEIIQDGDRCPSARSRVTPSEVEVQAVAYRRRG